MRRRVAHHHDVSDLDLRIAMECRKGLGLHFFIVADDVVDFGHGCKLGRIKLRRTACHDNAFVRIAFAHLANGLAGLALGLGGHGAGVQNDRIMQARLRRVVADDFALKRVQTASHGDDFGCGGGCRHGYAPPLNKSSSNTPSKLVANAPV